MSITDLKFGSVVKTAGGDITVRGLSLTDIIGLAKEHKATMESLFDFMSAKQETVDLDNMSTVAFALFDIAPDLAAHVIAAGSGETSAEARKFIKTMPFGVQIELLEPIIRQTFATEGGLKKVIEAVTQAMASTTNTLEHLRT